LKANKGAWVRAASSALSAGGLLKGNLVIAESALEAARTQEAFRNVKY